MRKNMQSQKFWYSLLFLVITTLQWWWQETVGYQIYRPLSCESTFWHPLYCIYGSIYGPANKNCVWISSLGSISFPDNVRISFKAIWNDLSNFISHSIDNRRWVIKSLSDKKLTDFMESKLREFIHFKTWSDWKCRIVWDWIWTADQDVWLVLNLLQTASDFQQGRNLQVWEIQK